MLTLFLDYSLRFCNRGFDFNTPVQNFTLAQCESRRLYCAGCVSIHSPTSWNSALWAPLHASIFWNEMVFTRACALWRRSCSLWGRFALQSLFFETIYLTRICSPALQSAFPPANTTSGAVHTRYFTSVSYAPCTLT